MKLVTAKIMREMDRSAIEDYKIPGLLLMENAGAGCARLIDSEFEEAAADGVAIVCGTGNNGGDGFVIARHLHNAGYDVEIYLIGDPKKIKGDALTNFEIAGNISVPIHTFLDEDEAGSLYFDLNDFGLVVDALFGTGLDRDVKGMFEVAIEAINAFDGPVFAVDMPSGLHTDTGQAMGIATYATMTATFGLAKVGQWLYPGKIHCGDICVVDISLPSMTVVDAPIDTFLIEADSATYLFFPRHPDSHKGDFGKGCVLGGSRGLTGAVAMAGRAALRTGAGLITIALPAALNDIVEAKVTEVMTRPLGAFQSDYLEAAAIDDLKTLISGMDAVAIGPGMGQSPSTKELLFALLPELTIPLVIDADGLNLLAGDLSVLEKIDAPIALTPHPGEFARLTGMSIDEIAADPVTAAREFAVQHRVHLILKGGRTIIATPGGEIMLNRTGNPGMATGGTGDVLTGVILGLLCQGVEMPQAIATAVYLHGAAGDLAAEFKGQRGLIAGDLIDALPQVMRRYEELISGVSIED